MASSARPHAAPTEAEALRRAQEALRLSEERFRALAAAAPLGIFSLDAEGGLTDCNPACCRICGFRPQEARGQAWLRSMRAQDQKALREACSRDEASARVVVFKVRGRRRWVSLHLVPLRSPSGQRLGYVGTAEDISEQRRLAEEMEERVALRTEQLERLNARLRAEIDEQEWAAATLRREKESIEQLLHLLPARICRLSPQGVVSFVNAAAAGGRPPAELMGRSCWETLFAGEDPARLQALWSRLPGGEAVECEAGSGEGRVLWTFAGRYDEQGQLVEILGLGSDVARRGCREEALDERLLRLRQTLDSSLIGILYMDGQGRVLEANRAFLELTGCSRQALETRELRWGDITPSRYHELDRRALAEAAAAGACRPYEKELEILQGRRLPVLVSVARLEEDVWVAFVADLRGRRNLEERLYQSQKMEAVGRLAGGLAHEYNNILAVVLGYAGLLLEQMGPDDPHRSAVEEIRRAADRAATLTRKLLSFSRRHVAEPQPLNLNRLIQDLAPTLDSLLGQDIELVLHLDRALRPVRLDAGQMEQVLVHLASNAREAMPKGGRLLLQTLHLELTGKEPSVGLEVEPGRYAVLLVSDTGCGMDRETLARAFEPFFSTRGGLGSGLGLPTVFGIVRQHGGSVHLDSEPGAGTTVSIYLPECEEAEAAPPPPAPPAPPAARGTETVLVAEDEEMVRRLVHRVLTLKGYRVLLASDGAEALQIFQEKADEVQLLLTDVLMPGMNGLELAQKVRQLRPGLPVVFMSGYADENLRAHGSFPEGAPFLHKPFTPDLLAGHLRSALEARFGPGGPEGPAAGP
ncbi:MAG TPA: PAS domain S-box protein [Candidatus Nitrosotenuis sp.]|jgi:PAS domain S-box-containing protein|nr:PAS domain S-box protein [Candidatus Nitrosotenuis sp.]